MPSERPHDKTGGSRRRFCDGRGGGDCQFGNSSAWSGHAGHRNARRLRRSQEHHLPGRAPRGAHQMAALRTGRKEGPPRDDREQPLLSGTPGLRKGVAGVYEGSHRQGAYERNERLDLGVLRARSSARQRDSDALPHVLWRCGADAPVRLRAHLRGYRSAHGLLRSRMRLASSHEQDRADSGCQGGVSHVEAPHCKSISCKCGGDVKR